MKKFTSNLKLFLLLAAMVAGVSDVWGYAKSTLNVTASGSGQVAVSTSSSSAGTYGASSSKDQQTGGFATTSGTHTYYVWVKPNANYVCVGLSGDVSSTDVKKSGEYYKVSVAAKTATQNKKYNATATFKSIYSVVFHANGGSGSMSNQNFVYDEAQNLKDNAFVKNYTVTYDANGGSCSTTYTNSAVSFTGWATIAGGDKKYNNGESVKNLTTTAGGTVNLYAKWGDATAVKLPNATKSNAVLEGWYDGSTRVGEAGASYIPTASVTLKAKWIDKYPFEISGTNYNMLVAGEQANAFNFIHAENATPHISVVSVDPINNGSGKVIEYDAVNNKIVAVNAGVAEIYFTQTETSTILAGTSATYTITVTKNENHISINGSVDSYTHDIYTDSEFDIALTATNTDYSGCAITATQTAGAAVVSFADGKVRSNSALGTATWSLSQPENYKYLAANATFSINVVQQAEATDCYVKTLGTDVIEKKLGNYSDNYTWDDENAAGVLYFSAKRQGASFGDKIQVEQYVDGTWSKVGEDISGYGTSYTAEQVTLNSKAKGIRFMVAGSLNNSITNVRVTRKTYLNADDVTIDKTSGNNSVCPGEQGVGTLVINRSLANGGDLKVVWDNDKFTIDGKTRAEGVTLGDVDCKTDISELPILFNAETAGTEEAHVTIYNNVYHATATITGVAVKRTQDFDWHIDATVSNGFSIASAAAFTSTRSSANGVTYTFSDTEVMDIVDGNIVAKSAGSVTITAHVDGDSEYDDLDETKTITVIEDLVQSIAWTQSLLGLKLGDPDLTLNATATSAVPGCTTNGNRLITYESANEGVVKVINGNQLQIVGLGTTQVTARQAGGVDADGHTYVAVEVEKKVVVKDPSAPCEAFVYEQTDNWEGDLGWNAVSSETKTVEFDFEGNEPGEYTLEYSGKPHTVAIQYYDGALYIDEYVDGAWKNVQSLGKPTANVYATATHTLNRKATKMRVRADGKTGYYYAKDCQVTLARYIELLDAGNVVSTLAFSTKCGASQSKDVAIHYSNLTDNLTFSLPADCPFSLDKTIMEASCGDKGSSPLRITYSPIAPETDAVYNLTISDGTTTTVVALHASATVTARNLVWNQTPTTQYTIETVTMTAETKTTLGDPAGTVAYSVVSSTPAEMATIAGNQMSFTKAGEVTVEAAAVEDARYSTPTAIAKTWTVIKTPTAVTTLPTITSAPLVAGVDIATLTFTPGVAQNTVNNEVVSGTFAITSTGSLVSDDNTIWFSFTPDDTDMYETTTASVVVTVAAGFIFDGNGGTSEEWGTNTNWNTGYAPTSADNVIVAADVVITGDINVNSLTINEGVQVTVEVTGKLTVGDGDSEDQAAYGDLYVHNNGEVVLNNGKLNVNNFYIESAPTAVSQTAASGQLENAEKLQFANAYIDITLAPAGVFDASQWYGFAVPFPVSVSDGVFQFNELGEVSKATDGVDYMIYYYDGMKRYNTGKGWTRMTGGVLNPGEFYYLTVNDGHNVMRFQKTASGALISDDTKTIVSYGDATVKPADANWNAMGNPMLQHQNASGVDFVQIYVNGESRYEAVSTSSHSFVVGSPFFVQAALGELDFSDASHAAFYAPGRAPVEDKSLAVELLGANEKVCDRIYMVAGEKDAEGYVLGTDLQKAGVTTRVAQMWIERYGLKLCVNKEEAISDETEFPVVFSAPAAGEYILRATDAATDYSLYLLHNGNVVWDLTSSDYSMDLQKGTTTGYSIVMQRHVPGVATGMDAVSEKSGVEKVLVNGELFIINQNAVYSAAGKRVK